MSLAIPTVILIALLSLLLVSPPSPPDLPAESPSEENPDPPRDRAREEEGIEIQGFVEGRYIVRFKQYKHGREHKLALEEQLGAKEKKGWKWIERNNAAAAYPTDFGVLQIQSDGLIDEIENLEFVKDVSAEARYSRALLFNKENKNSNESGRSDNAKKGPGKIFTRMSYEGGIDSNGTVNWGRKLFMQRSQITAMFGAEKLWGKGFTYGIRHCFQVPSIALKELMKQQGIAILQVSSGIREASTKCCRWCIPKETAMITSQVYDCASDLCTKYRRV